MAFSHKVLRRVSPVGISERHPEQNSRLPVIFYYLTGLAFCIYQIYIAISFCGATILFYWGLQMTGIFRRLHSDSADRTQTPDKAGRWVMAVQSGSCRPTSQELESLFGPRLGKISARDSLRHWLGETVYVWEIIFYYDPDDKQDYKEALRKYEAYRAREGCVVSVRPSITEKSESQH